MKKYLLIFLLGLAAVFLSCNKEEDSPDVMEGLPVDVELSFGASDALDVEVITKTDMGINAESKVWNIYLFLFDGSGATDALKKKFYGMYFDMYNLDNSTLSDYWTVSNRSASVSKTSGTIHLHTVSKSNCIVVGITNIDSDMVNISPERLAAVNTYADLKALTATMNQPIVERSGYFPMCGVLEGAVISSGTTAIQKSSKAATLQLERLDAKIVFNVKVGPKPGTKKCQHAGCGYIYDPVVGDPDHGVAAGTAWGSISSSWTCPRCGSAKSTFKDALPVIQSFTPGRWEVYSVPKECYVIERSGNDDASSASGDAAYDNQYFSLGSPGMNFHSQAKVKGKYYSDGVSPIVQSSFVFYMMENRKTPGSSPSSYADRELQNKTTPDTSTDIDGNHTSTTQNGDFAYAPVRSTYVKFNGFVEMAVQDNGAEEDALVSKTLSADVEYVVHLGDFSGSKWSNFLVERNHTYTYNITIVDVNDIRVEVENNHDTSSINDLDENEPAAEGQVTISREDIYECDSHYCSYVITFHYKNLKDNYEKLTWYVKTPFNPDGFTPIRRMVNGEEQEFYEGFADYEWVEFRRNGQNDDANKTYKQQRELYKPITDPETVNIVDLERYLKHQTELRLAGQANDFDYPDDDDKAKICFTAFVNEYYYEKNPLTGQYEEGLWKKVVNQPMRYMHILAGVQKSADEESKAIVASFSIRQKSIQSLYNVDNPDLVSAWGCEHFDDAKENDQIHGYGDGRDNRNRGNTDLENGRENTLREWGVITDASGTLVDTYLNYYDSHPGATSVPDSDKQALWSTYLDFTADNTTALLQPDYDYIRYSCMSRNRDNNGNGVIDLDEVRWYMGATNQLYGLFLGAYGIEGDAKLYQRDIVQQAQSGDAWRQHVISSSRYEDASSSQSSNDYPRLLWAEEGVTGSSPSYSGSGQTATFSTRCVRNLGSFVDTSDGNKVKDITYAPYTVKPQHYVVIHRYRGDGTPYEFVEGVSSTQNWYEDTYYDVDCSRINKASIRYFSSNELDYTDEFKQAACLPSKFRVAAVKDNPLIETAQGFKTINEYLNDNIGVNPYCPPGYRLPNVRELVVMRYFLPETMTNIKEKIFKNPYKNTDGTNASTIFTFTRTYWSFGKFGGTTKQTNKSGWGASYQKIVMCDLKNGGDDQKTNYVRCVKDLE